MTQFELLRAHVRALYTVDCNERMVAVNEPWGQTAPAPRLYVGRTLQGELLFQARRDLEDGDFARIVALIEEGIFAPEAYQPLLGGGTVIEELVYAIPQRDRHEEACVAVTPETIDALELAEFDWLREEIASAQPCFVYLVDGQVASLCRSVRISQAHEAGIETALQYKGRGYALDVLDAWATAVKEIGGLPLYSTLKTNLASQRVAAKAGLVQVAEGFHIG